LDEPTRWINNMNEKNYSWDGYRAFVAVLETGSLSAAARQLATSAPTIARHIETLEAALGVSLFSRSSTGLQATSAALALAPQIQTMVVAEAAIRRLASGEADSERGIVRLTASEIVGAEILPHILVDFQNAYPDTVIELSLTNRREDLLRRDSDIAVRMIRPDQEALVAKKIGVVDVGLYAHQRYIAQHGQPTTPEELLQHRIIGFDLQSSISQPTTLGSLNRHLFSFRCDSDLAQLAALRVGMGIGGCQMHIAQRNPELTPLFGGQKIFNMEMWLVMHRDLRQVKRVKLLFDWLAKGLVNYTNPST
jgi:DNA-binding transcriptional LysR family regulator